MPIYEYKCKDCEEVFELLTTSADEKKNIQCTKCGSENVTKLISAGAALPSAPPSLASAGCSPNSRFS